MSSPPPSAASMVGAGIVSNRTNETKSNTGKSRASSNIPIASTKTKNAAPATSLSPNSTPNASTSSPPSPLQIGKSFIKQYYQVLSTSPQDIQKFYKPNTSILSHSFLSSVPAESKILSATNQAEIFEWASSYNECKPTEIAAGGLCFDFGRGAIDAQETIHGGILLVVTGHMKLPNAQRVKAFVHTFFLNNGAPAGKMRQFYVHNDILRFIADLDSEENDGSNEASSQQLPGSTTMNAESVVSCSNNSIEVESKSEPVETPKPVAQAQERSRSIQYSNPNVNSDQKQSISKAEKSDASHTSDNLSHTKTSTTKAENKRKNSNAHSNRDGSAPRNSSKGKSASDNANGKKKAHEQSITTATTNEITTTSNTPKEEKKSKKNKTKGGRSRKERGKSPSSDQVDSNMSNISQPSALTTKHKDSKHQNSTSASNKPKASGSWAGVVAGGSGSATLPASNNSNPSAPPSPSARPSPAAAAAAATAAAHLLNSTSAALEENKEGIDMDGIIEPTATKLGNTQESSFNKNTTRGGQPPRSSTASNHQSINNSTITQRTAEATLFLKNIPDKTKEVDIRSIFEPYALDLNQKILGITLHASRGFCFVDFDAKLVVDMILKDVEALKEKNKTTGSNGEGSKFFIHGKILDVGRKVPMEKNRGSGGSSQHNRFRNRSSSPGNGAFHKPHRGGGHHHRRNSPRGGSRGSGAQQQRNNGK